MRGGFMACALLALAACGMPNDDGIPAGRSDTKQVPSNYTPGVHVTGHVNVGVVKNF